MKKFIMILFFSLLVVAPCSVKAGVEYGYSNVTGSGFKVRSSANSNASTIGYLYAGVNVEIVDKASGNGCGTWYKINYNNKTGWVCGISSSGARNVELYRTQTLRTYNRNPETDYERQLQNAGFPSSYWDKLSQLHKDHPNWNFIANNIDRGKDFSYVTWAETGAVSDGDIGKSLLYAYGGDTDLVAGYLKTDVYNYKTNKFTMQDSGGFYAARQDVVAYYMDPRNFLNENFIFQFELLSYNSQYQTQNVVESVFGNGYLRRYASNYVNAGKDKGVSPIHMATRSVQEGLNKENFLTTGSSFTYTGSRYRSDFYNRTFSNCFNFFNIGAYSDSVSAAQNAGIYACDPYLERTYGRPWNSVSSALNGGALYLAGSYITQGQDTLYFQKWNTASYALSNRLYTHQYMTNITAPAYEASDTYDSYNANGLINNTAFSFVIPVYKNMPEKTVMPSSLSPNNYLSSLKVDGVSVSGFDGDRTDGYTVNVTNNKTSVSIQAATINGDAKVTINNGNSISLNVGNNNIPVLVTAPNGEERIYYVTVVRENAPVEITDDFDKIVVNSGLKHSNNYIGNIHLNDTGNTIKTKVTNQNKNVSITIKDTNGKEKALTNVIATGDKLTVTLDGKSKNYTLYVYGDVDCNGKVSFMDYVLIENHIMLNRKLINEKFMAADVDCNGSIGFMDYVLVENHIMLNREI